MTELRNPELEAAILRDPTDRDAYLVYADWLEGHGDPRAELIALQCGTRRVPNLAKAVRRILATHAKSLLGPLASYANRDGEHFFWRYGFIQEALLHDGLGSVAEIIELLVRHPSGRFVTDLQLSLDDTETAGAIARLIAVAPPLRGLTCYSRPTPAQVETSARALWTAFPRLTRIKLQGAFELEGIAISEATEAELAALSGDSAFAIARAPWPKLERLALQLTETTATTMDLAPLFGRTDLASLTDLALDDAPHADELCKLLAAAPFAGQLRKLSLRGEELTDAGAYALAAAASAFRQLQYLDIREALLTDDGYAAIDAMGIVDITSDRYDSTEE